MNIDDAERIKSMISILTDDVGTIIGHVFPQDVICPTCTESVSILVVVTKTFNANTTCPKCDAVVPKFAVDTAIDKAFKDAAKQTLAEIARLRQEQEDSHATE